MQLLITTQTPKDLNPVEVTTKSDLLLWFFTLAIFYFSNNSKK